MHDSIIERRYVDGGVHNIILEIPSEEYEKIYDNYNNKVAEEILDYHFQYRGDDGRPSNVEIENNGDIIRISAEVDYLGNKHTEYKRDISFD